MPALLLIGAGRMGGAMLRRWLAADIKISGVIEPQPAADIIALCETAGVALNPPLSGLAADCVILAVKPQSAAAALKPLKPVWTARPLLLSIAAGVTAARLTACANAELAIIRAMPNTPALIGKGVSALWGNAKAKEAERTLAGDLLARLGAVCWLEDEAQLDAATALSGSGPAYFFYLAELMAQTGERLGLPKETARRLAQATATGAGALLEQEGADAAALRAQVTSPGGTTEAALKVLEKDWPDILARALAAAHKRAQDLS